MNFGKKNKEDSKSVEIKARDSRRTSYMIRIALFIVILLAIAGILCLGGYWGYRYFYADNPHFIFRELIVRDTPHYTQENVQKILENADNGGCVIGRTSLLNLDCSAVRKIFLNDAGVKDASVRRIMPGTLEISIVERKAIAFISGSGKVCALVDAEGCIYPYRDMKGLNMPMPYITKANGAAEMARGTVKSDKSIDAAVRLLNSVELRPTISGAEFAIHIIQMNYERERLECTLRPLHGNKVLKENSVIWIPFDSAKMDSGLDKLEMILKEKCENSGTMSYADLTLQYNVTTMD